MDKQEESKAHSQSTVAKSQMAETTTVAIPGVSWFVLLNAAEVAEVPNLAFRGDLDKLGVRHVIFNWNIKR